MTDSAPPRSPELMNANDTGLVVVDVQEKLLSLLPDRVRIQWNIRRLLDAAAALNIASTVTEQYPEKLGPTVAELAGRLDPAASKLTFSAAACGPLPDDWRTRGLYRILLCGIETHVCIQQTAFDLLAAGWMVYVAVDAVGTRHAVDHETALRRMEMAGVVLTSTEAAMYEWCRIAGTPEFRKISALSKESPPDK